MGVKNTKRYKEIISIDERKMNSEEYWGKKFYVDDFTGLESHINISYSRKGENSLNIKILLLRGDNIYKDKYIILGHRINDKFKISIAEIHVKRKCLYKINYFHYYQLYLKTDNCVHTSEKIFL